MSFFGSVTLPERERLADVDRLWQSRNVGELVLRLDDPSWVVRRAVVASLARAGDIAVAPLAEVLRKDRSNEGRIAAAVDALVASLGDADSTALELTHAVNPAVVCDGIQILGRRKSVAALPRLAQLAPSDDENVAMACIEALGRIGGEGSLELLLAAIDSGIFFRVFPAIDVLGRAGDPRAVAPLIALLERPHYVTEAARALGRSGQPRAAPALAALLLRANDALVRVAAVALVEVHDRYTSRFGPTRAVTDALAALDASVVGRRASQSLVGADATERAALCRVLGWVGGTNSIHGLLDLLDAEPEAAQAAAIALSTLTRDLEPFLLAALRDSGSDRRLLLLPTLGERAAASPYILACLQDESPNVRALACDAVGKLGERAALPRLFALLTDPDARVSQAAVGAIQTMGGEEVERQALAVARSTDPRERRSALRILSYFGWPSALDLFLEALEDTDERIRDLAALGLASMDDERATGALLAATRHTAARTRAAAVRALGYLQPNDSLRHALRSALRDPDAWVRYYACQALSRLKDDASAARIGELIADPAGHVRVAAIEALAQLRGERALGALHQALGSADPDVQRAALLATASVKSPTSIPLILGALTSPEAATRLVALSALAEFPDADALEPLSGATGDADESVRRAAISLLGARASAEATQVLILRLGNAGMRDRILETLSQPSAGRIEAIVSALHSANPEMAGFLVSILARMRRPDASAALEGVFVSGTPTMRRAAVMALASLDTPSSRALLESAAADDPDVEIRRLCTALLGR